MDIGDTTHQDEWKVVQEPTDNGVDSGIMDVVHLVEAEVGVATLPADDVEAEECGKERKREGTNPVDEGVSEEEVFDN